MHQTSFANHEYAAIGYITHREKFLGEINAIVPWAALIAAIEPVYSTGERGRPPIGIERMLHMYFLQQWYCTLSDVALEDRLYDITSMRHFTGIDLSCERVPDATILLKFRHLLENNSLTAKMLQAINLNLAQRGCNLDSCALIHQEQRPSARSCNAANQKGEQRQFWHESPHWCRRCNWRCTQRHQHSSERARHHQSFGFAAYGDSGCRGIEKIQQQKQENQESTKHNIPTMAHLHDAQQTQSHQSGQGARPYDKSIGTSDRQDRKTQSQHARRG